MNLEQLKAGVSNTKAVSFNGVDLRLRLLSEAELLQCRADALAFQQKNGLDDEGMVVDLVLRQLYLALDDGEGKRLAASVIEFKQQMTRPEREYFVTAYLELEKECSPSLQAMSMEEFETLREELKKNPDLILSTSNTGALKRLVRYLENQPRS